MKTITVNASKNYPVHIGHGILNTICTDLPCLKKAEKAVIISDNNVYPLYGETVANALKNAGLDVLSYVFPAGESSKSLSTYGAIVNYLAQNEITRSDILIALGGGVVGDITGFAAATYLRGISFIQVPTTLLAMVDSSVGGKTAIDLDAGKNLVGAFYQPDMVLCDLDTLSTLPDSVFRDGCAEVIKYGVLYDDALFSHLKNHLLSFDREYVISRCVELKRNVVMNDEFDTGLRQLLNLGHTIGHSIEKESGYQIPHGSAVAIGMAVVTKAAASFGICDKSASDAITAVISRFGLPTISPYCADALYQTALSDKKRTGNTLNLIVPHKIGHCEIHSTPINKLRSFIEAGL